MYKKGRLYDESLALYKRADSLGNAGASYFLAEWYSIGYGVAPTIPLRNHYLQRAADGGSQLGRYFLGQKELIEDSPSGRVQESIVLDQVRRAVRINTIDSRQCRYTASQACELLNTYYQSRGDYKSAYDITKLNVSQYESKDNVDIRYGIHLDNCIMRKKYAEAMDIIEKGKRGRRANCFIAHAYLLSNGLGCKKDVGKAETLLRFAADSLGEPKAYGALADLYEENGAPAGDVEFWRKLEEMGFNKSVK